MKVGIIGAGRPDHCRLSPAAARRRGRVLEAGRRSAAWAEHRPWGQWVDIGAPVLTKDPRVDAVWRDGSATPTASSARPIFYRRRFFDYPLRPPTSSAISAR
jgi:hypothetical protein